MMPAVQSFLFGAIPRDRPADLGLLPLRVVTGLSLALAHGLDKLPPPPAFVQMVDGMGFPLPELFAWGSTIAELGGGLLLAAGLLTRLAALLIVFNMTVVVLLAHPGGGFAARELGLLYGLIALTFLILGAGRYSFDATLRSP